MSVHVITFEIIGDGRQLADTFEAEKSEARSTFWAFVHEVGGTGYRPGHNGTLRSVFFDCELPQGWRAIDKVNGLTEALPARNTKVGKALRDRYGDLPEMPQASRLARDLGYSPSFMPISNGKIYFPSEVRVTFPTERHFLRLPLTADDGFKPDDSLLRELRESEFMRAVEDHNAEARRQKEAEAAA